MDFRRFNPFPKSNPEQGKSRIRPEILRYWTDNDLAEHLGALEKVRADIRELKTRLLYLKQFEGTNKVTDESIKRGEKTLRELSENFPDVDNQIEIFKAAIESRK